MMKEPTITLTANSTMKNFFSKGPHVLLVLTCLGFTIMGFLRLNDTSLYTDSTRYVIWGTSFSHARGFVDDTQPDPERYVVNAPLYSVILAPVLLFFPNSLIAAKIWTLFIGVVALVLFFVWLNRRLGPGPAILGTVILACSPLMIVMATEAMSEMCFLAMMFLAMILLESFEGDEKDVPSNSIYLFVILSLLPVLREVSIALVGAVVIVMLIQKHYKSASWIAIGTVLVMGAWMFRNIVLVGVPPTSQSTNASFILGHFVTPGDTPMIGELIQRIFVNIQGFYGYAVSLLAYPFPQPLIVDPHQMFRVFFKSVNTAKYILPIVVLPLVVMGIVNDGKQGFQSRIRLLFCVLYTFIIVVYPVQDIRFLLPLFPFLIYFVLLSVQTISKLKIFRNKNVRIGLASFAVVLVLFPNLDCDFELARTNWRYQHAPADLYHEIKQSGASKELYIRPWRPFGNWIRENLPDSTVIASSFKELAIFIGNKKILEINYGVPLPMFEHFLRDNGVDYIVSAGAGENNRPYEFAMKETERYWFEPVYSLSGLLLYRVHSAFMETPSTQEHVVSPPDTSTAAGFLRFGRSLLLNGDYSSAVEEFVNAYKRGSSPALTRFEITIAYAMAVQRDDATQSFEQLYRLPQSTSYIPAATAHLHAMETYLDAMNIQGLYHRSSELFNIAGFYWNFGYPKQGYTILRNILKEDTTYFVGLLWGWDYAKKLGDAKQANVYLNILESLDPTNAVVKGFHKLDAIDDTLRRSNRPTEQSRLLLEKGKIFWSIGLFDDAYDWIERSIGKDRNNSEAQQYLAGVFEQSNKPWAVRKVQRMANEARLSGMSH